MKLSTKSLVKPNEDTMTPDLESDEKLMSHVANGLESNGAGMDSRRAFEILFQKWKKPIMSYLYQMIQDPRIAEDLTQETFLKVYRSRESYQPTAKFSTWLWTLAKHTGFDYLRKKREVYSGQGFDDTPFEMADSAALADEQLATAVFVEATETSLRDCLNALTPRARTIVELQIFSEEDYESIAKITDEKLGTIKTILFRSKISLKECIQKNLESRGLG
jgi:RNA polymerase sigma-70 factor, ECF subfamily